ncbi:FUSC family protein [Microbispora sp. NPDC049125]|uniref:FUSC family protein n=1 Tax=Microbispora sp. NPDC049125 TaxID=3154929 RepID=UPI0034666BEF
MGGDRPADRAAGPRAPPLTGEEGGLRFQEIKALRAPRLEDPRLALGFGLTGAAGLVIPLLIGLLTGHATGGAIVGLGAWLVASRANLNPAGVRTPYLLGAVVSVGAGTSLGLLLSGKGVLLVLVASALAGLGGLIRPIGVTPALTLLLTIANPVPLDPVQHTGLQLLGGLLASVLLTLPWPWRRTRPFVAALSDVAGALAALAEAAVRPDLDPDEWDALRGRASATLAEVRTAHARHRWQQRSRAAEEVTAALRRVFHEIVALHGLVATLHRHAPGAADEVGLREMAGSIAGALSAFMAPPASSTDGSAETWRARRPAAPCVPTPQAVLNLSARVDALRERSPGGKRGMVVLVLLRQIAHCADRIGDALAGSAEAAGVLCSPRLTPLAVPTAARPRLAFDEPGVRHALRVLLGTAFASTVIEVFKPPYPHWMVIAVLVTIQPTYGETRAKVWARIGGSTAGGLVTAGILHVTPGHGMLVLLIGVSAALAFGLASTHHAYWATFMTMCVLLLLDFQVQQTAKIAESRVVLTVIGGLIAIACTRLLWPRGETVRLAERVARMLDSHAAVVRALAQVSRGKTTIGRVDERVRRASLDAETVTGSLCYAAQEPGGTAPAEIRQAVEAAQRVRDDLLTLIAVLRDEPVEARPVPDVLDAIANGMEAVAESVRGGEPYASAGEVERCLADDAMWLGEMVDRCLDELEGTRGGTSTAVSHSLLRTAALDQSLRSLHDDAVRLSQAAVSAFSGRKELSAR